MITYGFLHTKSSLFSLHSLSRTTTPCRTFREVHHRPSLASLYFLHHSILQTCPHYLRMLQAKPRCLHLPRLRHQHLHPKTGHQKQHLLSKPLRVAPGHRISSYRTRHIPCLGHTPPRLRHILPHSPIHPLHLPLTQACTLQKQRHRRLHNL